MTVDAMRGNSNDLLTRYQDLAAQELEFGEMNWWWLSFASGQDFYGVVIVYAHGMLEAMRICEEQGFNPGGEVLGAIIPAEKLPAEKYRHKLLDEKQIREFLPDMKKYAIKDDDSVEVVK